jgi:hypothetical protein
MNACYAMWNSASHMVVGRTLSIMWKQKNKLAVQNKASNNLSMNVSEMEKQLLLATQEATFSLINLHAHKQNAQQ